MLGFSQYEWTIPNIEENRAFNEKYEKRYGTKAHAYAAMPYSNLLMLAATVKKAGTIETEAVIDCHGEGQSRYSLQQRDLLSSL
jgi:ABC-type branched-subunit amino acid transport system substrate-binding protein